MSTSEDPNYLNGDDDYEPLVEDVIEEAGFLKNYIQRVERDEREGKRRWQAPLPQSVKNWAGTYCTVVECLWEVNGTQYSVPGNNDEILYLRLDERADFMLLNSMRILVGVQFQQVLMNWAETWDALRVMLRLAAYWGIYPYGKWEPYDSASMEESS